MHGSTLKESSRTISSGWPRSAAPARRRARRRILRAQPLKTFSIKSIKALASRLFSVMASFEIRVRCTSRFRVLQQEPTFQGRAERRAGFQCPNVAWSRSRRLADRATCRSPAETRNKVSTYWQTYRQVLVTNYRDFLLIGEDAHGRLHQARGLSACQFGSGILEPPPDTSKIRAGDRPSVDGISQSTCSRRASR